jgi:hypothetical protein
LDKRLPLRYPDEPPELQLVHNKGLGEAKLGELKKLLAAKALELRGSEMIYELANFTREYLSKNKPRTNASFYEQMVTQKLQNEKEQENRASEQARLATERETEEERMAAEDLALRIQEEIQRKKSFIKQERMKKRQQWSTDTLEDDQNHVSQDLVSRLSTSLEVGDRDKNSRMLR